MNDDLTINVFIPSEERGLAHSFMEIYEPLVYQGTVDLNKRESKKSKKIKLKCRYCKKSSADTSFTEHTHLLSKLIGNKGFYSDDECDQCNKLFQGFESDLAKYLGTSRIFNDITADAVPPSFESANGAIGIKKYPSGIIYVKKKKETDGLRIDPQAGIVDIEMQTQSYTPALVYNAFLKMALAILPESLLAEYEKAFEYILNARNYSTLSGPRILNVVETKIEIERPFAILFQKKNFVHGNYPMHTFCLYVRNYMFQIIFPFSEADLKITDGCLTFHQAPYILLAGEHDDIVVRRYSEGLHSLVKTNKDNSIHLKFDPQVLENLVAIQLDSGFDF